MPADTRKKKFAVKFELSPRGLIGATIVCLCIFLWMFLLGVWAGQTLLSTPPGTETVAKKTLIKKKKVIQSEVPAQPLKPAVTIKREVAKKAVPQKKAADTRRPEPEEDPSFFSVQVAAFKDKELAGKAVKNWRSKGYDAFSRSPEGGNDPFTRVYIGKFEVMDAAKEHAELLKKKEKQKPFIALLPGDK